MRRLPSRAAALALALAGWLAAAPAAATVLIGADLGEMTRAARFVARGRVVAAEGRWTVDHRTIETRVTLQVEAYLKGSLGETLDFAVPGGRLGRYRNIVVGAPTFAVGEQVVVFLDARGPGVPFLVGLGQGAYRVVPSPDRTGFVVTPPPLVGVAGAAARVTRGDPARRPMAVDAFEALVRGFAEARP